MAFYSKSILKLKTKALKWQYLHLYNFHHVCYVLRTTNSKVAVIQCCGAAAGTREILNVLHTPPSALSPWWVRYSGAIPRTSGVAPGSAVAKCVKRAAIPRKGGSKAQTNGCTPRCSVAMPGNSVQPCYYSIGILPHLTTPTGIRLQLVFAIGILPTSQAPL